jgi:hypothetical protein
MLFNNMHKTSPKKKDPIIKFGYKDLLEVNLNIICQVLWTRGEIIFHNFGSVPYCNKLLALKGVKGRVEAPGWD